MAEKRVAKKRPVVTAQHVREFLNYNPETGSFIWKHRSVDWFPDNRAWRIWNTRFAGSSAGSLHSSGYMDIGLFGYPFRAHRLAWVYVHGEWPEHEIDHINGVRDDNRIDNLRDVTSGSNKMNTKKPINNSSGAIGVMYLARAKTWVAQIQFQGRNHHIGLFRTKEAAITARKEKEKEFGFHENHGR